MIEESVTVLPLIPPTTTTEPLNNRANEESPPCSPVERKRPPSLGESHLGRKNNRNSDVPALRTFDDHSSSDSEDDLTLDENRIAPSFNGRRIAPNNEKNSNSSIRTDKDLLHELYFQQSKLESRYLQPLNFSIQRQSKLLKEVLEGQKKIIRGLRRRAVSNREKFH